MIMYLFLIMLLQPASLKSYQGIGAQTGVECMKIVQTTVTKSFPQIVAASENIGQKSAQIISTTAKDSLPQLATASANLGLNFGLGTLIFLSDKIAQAGSTISSGATTVAIAAKTGAITVITSPITPYVAVGVGVAGTGYVVYKVYYHYNSETGQKIAVATEEIAVYNKQAEAEEAKARFYSAHSNACKAQIGAIEAKQALIQKLAATAAA